jgi:hypothetical protein
MDLLEQITVWSVEGLPGAGLALAAVMVVNLYRRATRDTTESVEGQIARLEEEFDHYRARAEADIKSMRDDIDRFRQTIVCQNLKLTRCRTDSLNHELARDRLNHRVNELEAQLGL